MKRARLGNDDQPEPPVKRYRGVQVSNDEVDLVEHGSVAERGRVPAPVTSKPSIRHNLGLDASARQSQQSAALAAGAAPVGGQLPTSTIRGYACLFAWAAYALLVLLPNADQAWIPPGKLRDYALDPDHPRGGPKARLFTALLAIRQRDWLYLRDQILAGVKKVEARPHAQNEYGALYEVIIPVRGLNGHVHPVRTGWIVLHEGDGIPLLTTAYVRLPPATVRAPQ